MEGTAETLALERARDGDRETFLRAYRRLGRYRSRRHLAAWLQRTATNRSIDLLGGASAGACGSWGRSKSPPRCATPDPRPASRDDPSPEVRHQAIRHLGAMGAREELGELWRSAGEATREALLEASRVSVERRCSGSASRATTACWRSSKRC